MQKIDITDKELLGFIGKQESQEIGAFNSYGDRLLKQLEGGTGLVGDKLPWSKTHSAVRLGQGQLSIWSGIRYGQVSMVTAKHFY
jgi:hypothetical protein